MDQNQPVNLRILCLGGCPWLKSAWVYLENTVENRSFKADKLDNNNLKAGLTTDISRKTITWQSNLEGRKQLFNFNVCRAKKFTIEILMQKQNRNFNRENNGQSNFSDIKQWTTEIRFKFLVYKSLPAQNFFFFGFISTKSH